MEEDQQAIRSLPERPRRHCPECGARVADGATICLICGTALTEGAEEQPVENAMVAPTEGAEGTEGGDVAQQDTAGSGRQLRPLRIAVLAFVAVVTLTGSVILGLSLAQGEVASELPTSTPTTTPTPTITPRPTATPTPTATPLPTPTFTPVPPIVYVVQSGDVLSGIAAQYDLTVDELIAYNNLDSEFIVEGEELLIPPPTPTPGPPPTLEPGQPTATPSAYLLHTVRAGDTLSTIAEEYGVTVDVIRLANDIPADSETIKLNDVLIIPQSTPTPQPEVIENTTPTATPGLTQYPAPTMLYPPDGAEFAGPDAVVALQWASVGILDDREFYQVELIVPTDDQKVTYEETMKSTVWRVPGDLFPPETVEDRTFAWRVFVVRQVTNTADPDYKIISLTSGRHSFTWSAEAAVP